MSEELKINKASFSLKRQSKPRTGVKPSFEGEVAKSSYEIPKETHQAFRMLSVKLNKRLNVLFEEAVNDLLAKYGE